MGEGITKQDTLTATLVLIAGLALAAIVSTRSGRVGSDALIEQSKASNPQFRRQLAQHYAPVWHQLTDTAHPYPEVGYKADLITKFNYDGDWVGANNWENLDAPTADLRPFIYCAIAETSTHWFVSYTVFHPRDWLPDCDNSPIWENCHENNMEGAIVTIRRDESKYGEFQLVETVYHLWFVAYAYDQNIRNASIVVTDYLKRFQFEKDALDNDASHVKLCIEAQGHGVLAFTLDNCPPSDDQIVYRYKYGAPELPETGNDADVGYALIDLEDPDEGLWVRRSNESAFVSYGVFREDTYAQNRAHAPWAWDMSVFEDGVPEGWVFTNPAWATARHLDNLGRFSLMYLYNPFCEDQGSCNVAPPD